jgi:hypothetical protein
MAAVAACDGDEGSPGAPGGSDQAGAPSGGAGGSPALGGASGAPTGATGPTCERLSLCAQGEYVALYRGMVPASPAGGTIADGDYRLAFAMTADGAGVQRGAVPVEGLRIEGGSYRYFGANGGSAGALRRTAAPAPALTFAPQASCDDACDGDAVRGPRDALVREHPYSVAADGTLHLYPAATAPTYPGVVLAFARVDAMCGERVAEPPATPGNSATCEGAVCACAFTELTAGGD